jgi:hypothetical protein
MLLYDNHTTHCDNYNPGHQHNWPRHGSHGRHTLWWFHKAESHSLATNTTGHAMEVAVAIHCDGFIRQNRIAWPPTQLATPWKSLSAHIVKVSYSLLKNRFGAAMVTPVYSQWCSGGYTVVGYRCIPFPLIEWVQHNLLFLTCSAYHNLLENYTGWKKSSSFFLLFC